MSAMATMWMVQAPTGKIRGTYSTLQLAKQAAKNMVLVERDGPFMVYACTMVDVFDVERKNLN